MQLLSLRGDSVPSMNPEGRVYGGLSDEQRRAERRERLVAAGLELFGTQGAAATSIEQLCQVGRVATRSFYEEFGSREELLRAVYRGIIEEAGAAAIRAVADAPMDLEARTRAGVAAYVKHLTDDPRRARVVGLEGRSTPALQMERTAALHRFGALATERALLPGNGDAGQRVLALALAGAISEVLADWATATPPRSDVSLMVDVLSATFVAALTPPAHSPGE